MRLKLPVAMFCIAILMNICAYAQRESDTEKSTSSSMMKQSDSLKSLFAQQGFEIVREAVIAMESQYEKPIILSLREGTWYRVIFIGEQSSKLYEMRMYDLNEKQVVYEKQKPKDAGGNIINYDYIPRFTEFHMIKPVQINRNKKGLIGQMLLFKKTIKA